VSFELKLQEQSLPQGQLKSKMIWLFVATERKSSQKFCKAMEHVLVIPKAKALVSLFQSA
jgi:hypothetical protein